MSPGYCDGNESLRNTYDCSCFSDKILEARKQDATFARAAGGEPILHPQLSVLAGTVDLRACVNPNHVTAYIDRFVERAFPAKAADWRAAVAACVSAKLIDQMKSDPHAMVRWSVDQTNDFTACRMANSPK